MRSRYEYAAADRVLVVRCSLTSSAGHAGWQARQVRNTSPVRPSARGKGAAFDGLPFNGPGVPGKTAGCVIWTGVRAGLQPDLYTTDLDSLSMLA